MPYPQTYSKHIFEICDELEDDRIENWIEAPISPKRQSN